MDNAATLPAKAPTMGQIAKISYTHDAMIDLIIREPGISQAKLAAAFGYSASWVSNIMASDAFQGRLAERRAELIDPAIALTLDERAKALFVKSQEVLMEKLTQPTVKDSVALKAFELGARSLGMGQPKAPGPAEGTQSLEVLADRIRKLNEKDITGESKVVSEE